MSRLHKLIKRLRTDESGQTSVFIIGVAAIVLLFATVIIGVTTIQLEARKLLSVADAAAHRAAQEFTVDAERNTVQLSSAQAHEVVAEHLTDVDAASRFSEVSIARVRVVDDGGTIEVTLAARTHPPIVNWIVPSGVDISAEGSARTQLSR